MNCPNCGKELRLGIVRANPLRDNKVFWYPENYKNKSIINEKPVALSLQAEGYYCDECMTAFASFQKKNTEILNVYFTRYLMRSIRVNNKDKFCIIER